MIMGKTNTRKKKVDEGVCRIAVGDVLATGSDGR